MPTAFLITPFTPESAGGEDPDVFDTVQEAISAAAARTGVDLVRADDIFAPGVVIDQIREAIENADLVVAVCTGKNPNVFYELGMAEVIGHRPILIAPDAADLPFDIGHLRAQLYQGRLDGLQQRLERAFQAGLDAAIEMREPEPALDPEFLTRVENQIRDFLDE